MDGAINVTTTDCVHSLANWWALAGVDEVVGEVEVEWLARDAKPEAAAVAAAPVEVEQRPPAFQSKPVEPLADWPKDIATLQDLVAAGALLPGNMFGGKPVAPVGPVSASVMIVSDLPDTDETASGILGSGASGRLLTAMLAAIGIELAASYWTVLATTIPATGELPETALPQLTDFVRHQIDLVNPERIILLGSVTASAFLGLPFQEARQSLRQINHDGGNKTLLTTFHPRTLLARPAYKGEAWKDLQLLVKEEIA